ncbi:MAG TPA: aminoglycoside phosphotransferase family protein [Jatrophihabitantaceae bacterium]
MSTATSRTVRAIVSSADRYLGAAPAFEVPSLWWPDVEPVTAHLDATLGVPTAVLRLVDVSDSEAGRGGTVTYRVEALGNPRPDVLDPSPRANWSSVIEPHPYRAAWAEPTGPQQLIDWAVDALGGPLAGRPVQVKSWNLSCLYRLPTGDGAVWAKATGRFLATDAEAIRIVRRYDPSLAPDVIASDPTRRRSLLREAPGVDCFQTDATTIRAVVARWVAAQAAAVDDPALAALPQLAPSDLAARLASVLDHEVGPRLTADELEAARRLVCDIPELVGALEAARFPRTLVHGDFHPGNWRSDGTGQMIVDWADCYVGHPAADIQRLIDWLPEEQGSVATQTWVDAWRAHRPTSEPERALEPMAVLARVIGAIVYQRFLDNIEPAERVYHEDDPVTEIRTALASRR